MGEIVSASQSVRADQLVQTLVAVCGPQDILEKFPSEVVKQILGIPFVVDFWLTSEPRLIDCLLSRNIEETLLSAVSWADCENIFNPLIRALVSK